MVGVPDSSPSHTVAVTVAADPAAVYDYLVDPRNLPAWAAGLAKSVEQRDGQWVVDSGNGEWIIEFAPRNTFGVADHVVTQPDGTQQLNPMRVLPNGDGAELLFTLFRAEVQDDDAWQALLEVIAADLQALADILAIER